MVAFNGMNWLFGGAFVPGAESECGNEELHDIRVGARLRSRRLSLGMSTMRASDGCGISRALLAAYERGEIPIPPARLVTLSQLLEIDIQPFLR